MNNVWDLKPLREKRGEVLKAELAAWLHDAGKLHPGHQSKFLRDKLRSNYIHTRFGPGKSKNFLEAFSRLIPGSIIGGASVYPERIIRDHHKRGNGSPASSDPIVRLIQRVDWVDSEFDRSEIVWTGPARKLIQPVSLGYGLFDVFGFEGNLYTWSKEVEHARTRQPTCKSHPNTDTLLKLLCALKRSLSAAPFELSQEERRSFLSWLRLLFSKAAGDTRYSVNDISLWDHSHSVSTLFKAFISWSELLSQSLVSGTETQSRIQNHSVFLEWFRPQLLPLRIDGLAYLSQSNNVPDLLARRALLQKVYDTWQGILEWEFPLAGEVYRDENGPVFLTFLRDREGKNAVPLRLWKLPKGDEGSVLGPAYKQAENLEEYLRQAIVQLTHGDLTLPPKIKLFTYAQKQKRSEDEKSLGDLLRGEFEKGMWLQADAQCVERSWQRVTRQVSGSKGEEICSVCGLRPQGFGRWCTVEVPKTNGREGHHRQKKERRAEQKEALLEWLLHYQSEHQPYKKWEEKTEEERKCQVCKAISRGVCGVCLERRQSRAKPWVHGIQLDSKERFLQGSPETVWLDEVADRHGRVALIVGYFPLEHWLDGTLVESLAMFKRTNAELPPVNRKITVLDENNKPVDVVLGPKPVSYSRIRRVWETTRRFWQDVAPTDAPSQALQDMLKENAYGLKLKDLWEGPLSLENSLAGQAINEKRSRIFLKGEVEPANRISPYHAYELEIQGRKVAVLWVPEKDDEVDIPQKYRGGFWVIENLDYLDNVYGKSFEKLVRGLAGQSLNVYEPTEYGRPGQEQATFTIAQGTGVQSLKENYIPLIPILAEPRTFMALVPADKAFEVVKAIKTKYEREMGKVRNRLPLHLGIVFADSHQPLRTILDAGRKMLRQSAQPVAWKVTCLARKQATKGDSLPSRFKSDENGQFKEWYEVSLNAAEKKITWYVPAFMGDGATEDHWYPYVFLETSSEPADRKRYYKTDLSNPWNPEHPWLVHAGELKPKDRIYFTPATFDFVFFDHSGKRFEIVYDEKGQRLGTSNRPYLLDQLEDLEDCWNLLTHGRRHAQDQEKPAWRLSSRQIHQIRDAIEQKREEWFRSFNDSLGDDTFKRFCKDLLANAEWREKPSDAELDRLTEWAVNGVLTDAIELFLHIMKQRERASEQTKEGEAEK